MKGFEVLQDEEKKRLPKRPEQATDPTRSSGEECDKIAAGSMCAPYRGIEGVFDTDYAVRPYNLRPLPTLSLIKTRPLWTTNNSVRSES